MLRDDEKPLVLPPCACCGQPAPNAFWETHLCDGCFGAWRTDAPTPHLAELAYADAHPEDVASRGVLPYRMANDDGRWVLLKGDLSTRVARTVAMTWVRQRAAKARAA